MYCVHLILNADGNTGAGRFTASRIGFVREGGEPRSSGAAAHRAAPPNGAPRLLDRVRGAIRAAHFSRRTEEACVGWIRRYVLFHGKRHPAEMGAPEVAAFLTSLAVDRQVSAATQNQALASILFLYKRVLEVELPWMDQIVRAKASRRLPVVLTRGEVGALLEHIEGTPRLVAMLLYGSGLRLLEALRLRVKDVDFARCEIVVREGKGGKDCRTMLPLIVRDELMLHLEAVGWGQGA